MSKKSVQNVDQIILKNEENNRVDKDINVLIVLNISKTKNAL